MALLSSAALCALSSAMPVQAQVAGNPGDLHTPTTYTKGYMTTPQPRAARLAPPRLDRSRRLPRSPTASAGLARFRARASRGLSAQALPRRAARLAPPRL